MNGSGDYGLAIIGGGPSGNGVLVHAAVAGRLTELLDGGVALIERSSRIGGGRLGLYDVQTNSQGTSFIECVECAPAYELFEPVRSGQAYRAIASRREEGIEVSLVTEFLEDVGSALTSTMERHRRCRVCTRTEARAVVIERDGSVRIPLTRFTVDGRATNSEVRARSVVMALGSYQDLECVLGESLLGSVRVGHAGRSLVMTGQEVMTRAGRRRLVGRMTRSSDAPVVILGGSHSAFEVARGILSAPRLGSEDPSIVILHRSPIRVRYSSEASARADGYHCTLADVCPATGRVNRAGGLQGRDAELWRRITGRARPVEDRVTLRSLDEWSGDPGALERLLRSSAAVVACFGYRPQWIPIHAHDGSPLPLMVERGGDLVDRDLRVLQADGRPIEQVFAVGLGAGFRASHLDELEPSFHGHANGVWLYQNTIGARLLGSLDTVQHQGVEPVGMDGSAPEHPERWDHAVAQ